VASPLAFTREGAYHAGMLPETRATSYAHDPALGTVVVYSQPGSRPALQGDLAGKLLLDAKGHLVGVDVAPDSQDRLIVMLGPHESVASSLDARVHVEGGGRTVTLHGSAAKLVTPGANPYVF
jgi:hypothetical protein